MSRVLLKMLDPMSPITRKVTKCILRNIYYILINRISWSLRRTFDEGGLQEFALVDTAPYLTAKIPENITEDEASTLPTALNTANIALYDSDGFGFPSPFSGDRSFGNDKAIFVTGGSSVIGLGGKRPVLNSMLINIKHFSFFVFRAFPKSLLQLQRNTSYLSLNTGQLILLTDLSLLKLKSNKSVPLPQIFNMLGTPLLRKTHLNLRLVHSALREA